jgi:hypothetical protein
MKMLARTFLSWLPLAVAITGICLLVYATVQQNYRQSLNDPQIQMAEDAASALTEGVAIKEIIPPNSAGTVYMGKSLAPWLAIYDKNGKPLVSSATWNTLDSDMPVPPEGVFEAARENNGKDTSNPNENRVTWEFIGVRQAIVVVWDPKSEHFVVAGRDMREVEEREGHLSSFVLLAWLALLAATFISKAFARFVSGKIG